MKFRSVITLLAATLINTLGLWAAEDSQTDTVVFRVHFRCGKTDVEPSYMGNRATMDSIKACLAKDTGSDSTLIKISSSTSAEGASRLNQKLRAARASSLQKVVREYVPSARIVIDPGHAPRYYDNQDLWPYDRFAQATVIKHTSVRPQTPPAEPAVAEFAFETIDLDFTAPSEAPGIAGVYQLPKTRRNCFMSLQTNMLYDVAALPSIAFEYYFGRNISAALHWTYGWWSSNSKHRYWRAYGGDITARYWFGKKARLKPLTGHHGGFYFQTLIYDFEFGGKGYLAGRPGANLWEQANYAAGVEYGYSLPVSRHLNIDFSLGVGYMWGRYYEYIPRDGHYVWQRTKRLRYFGPTKAEISLVWLLGRGNVNKKGGGYEK